MSGKHDQEGVWLRRSKNGACQGTVTGLTVDNTSKESPVFLLILN
jgi:hypothetical protein